MASRVQTQNSTHLRFYHAGGGKRVIPHLPFCVGGKRSRHNCLQLLRTMIASPLDQEVFRTWTLRNRACISGVTMLQGRTDGRYLSRIEDRLTTNVPSRGQGCTFRYPCTSAFIPVRWSQLSDYQVFNDLQSIITPSQFT